MGPLRKLGRRLLLAWHRPRHWHFRPGTFDRRAFREVVVENEYRLPRDLPAGAVVLDIGANVGAFALAALRRGAAVVHCFEPHPGNFEQLARNLRPYARRARLHRCAIWRSDRPEATLALHNPDEPGNTGAIRVAAAGDGPAVAARPLDDVLAELTAGGRRLALAKLDCEGAEWPVLFTSRMLSRIDVLCGEYHLGLWPEAFRVAGAAFTAEGLVALLNRHGLAARAVPHPRAGGRLGHFFATRNDLARLTVGRAA